jgi:hypothetical protein
MPLIKCKKGSMYMLFAGVLSVVFILSVLLISLASTEIRRVRDDNIELRARTIAESGLELGLAKILDFPLVSDEFQVVGPFDYKDTHSITIKIEYYPLNDEYIISSIGKYKDKLISIDKKVKLSFDQSKIVELNFGY